MSSKRIVTDEDVKKLVSEIRLIGCFWDTSAASDCIAAVEKLGGNEQGSMNRAMASLARMNAAKKAARDVEDCLLDWFRGLSPEQ